MGCFDVYLDADGDGYGAGEPRCLCAPEGDWSATAGGDCRDDLAHVHPGAVEICDDVDNDCDGVLDGPGASGCSTFYLDGDGDGFGDPDQARCLCGADADSGYTSKTPTDCDDGAAATNPGAAEVCDAVDNDCDTVIDEEGAGNCSLHFVDSDGDTWGDPARFACLCAPTAAYPATRGGDCADDAWARNPGQDEACDGVDNDCDGNVDEGAASGCDVYYRDSDGDGHGLTGDARCRCAPEAPWDATVGGDCDDAVETVHPDAVEACNGRDDDCDAAIDEEGAELCQEYWLDVDLDTFGLAGQSRCLCAPTLPYSARNDTDCDDDNPFVNPHANEVCNLLDDDCDEVIDEGVEATCTAFYYDEDGDNWGLPEDSRCLCGPDGLYRAVNAGDCDDTDDTVHPFASEGCDDVDNDCDDATDEEGAEGCQVYYADRDGDGVGQLAQQRCLCAAEAPHTAAAGGDCDESDPEVFPGAAEVCNAKDDDCDGVTDPPGAGDCQEYLRDSDGDGWGVAGDTLCLCEPTLPFTTQTPGDCNDADAALHLGATERCNGKDDDCSGLVDDPGTAGCVTFYRDDDGDTWGQLDDSLCLCAPAGPYKATSPGDCDDTRVGANPAVTEVCNDLDDDCDDEVDEPNSLGCDLWLRDEDGDLYGVSGDFKCLCEPDGVYRADQGGDCADAVPLINPGATEACDGADNDCDGATDEEGAAQCTTYLRDLDRDGFGVDEDARCLCAASGAWDAQVGGDCNDSTALISPASEEFCNETDDDCDAAIDEQDAVGCHPHWVDADGDGWGVGTSRCLCEPEGDYRATQAVDCDDQDAGRNPAQAEACNQDAKDEDCDGQTDEANAMGCVPHYEDGDADGYGLTLSQTCLCGPQGVLTATAGGDCDDEEPLANPGQSEACNGVDDDCDGQYDEGCGMQEGGWPTAKYDARRSGHAPVIAGPATKTLRWKRQLDAQVDISTSATVDLDGDIIIGVGAKVFKLDPTDGSSIWEADLPAVMDQGASTTLRQGGTIVVPAGNGLVMLNADGEKLWHTELPGAASDTITGSPLVDEAGDIYTVGYAFLYALDPGGDVRWSIAVPNLQYVPAHVGLSPTTGRIHFGASNHALFAVERTGFVAWTFIVPDRDVDASVAISADGVIYQSFGNYVHRVVDMGNYGEGAYSANAGSDLDAHVSVWRDGSGADHVMTNANKGSGLRSFAGHDLTHEWTFAQTKHGGRNSTPIIDASGVTYVGDDQQHFHAVNPDGSLRWRFGSGDGLVASDVDSHAALVPGGVIFGDDAGYLYFIADP